MRVSLGLVAVCLLGCDSSATLFPKRVVFIDAQTVGAWPARATDDGWVPVCRAEDGVAEGFITHVTLIGSVNGDRSSDTFDEDVSIRPGDVVESLAVDGPLPFDIHLDNGSMSVVLTCIDPLTSDAAPSDDAAGCPGMTPAAVLEDVHYQAHTANRLDPNEVLVLLDMSASMSGLVDADSLLEKQSSLLLRLPDLKQVASDGGARRVAAVQELIRSLNARDRVGVLTFGEEAGGGVGYAVPCGPGLGMSGDDGLAQCFGTNHDQWVGNDSTLSRNSVRTFGRSNLWKALDYAYTFMADPARPSPAGASRHIIVVTDGPDTCQGAALTPESSACSAVGAKRVHDRLAAALDDPNAPEVHVHFLQFEALGYPGRDADQVTAACLGRGHYRFVGTNALRDEANVVSDALSKSILELRFALMGEWQIVSSVVGLALDGTNALGGRLVIGPDSHLVPVETQFGFAGNFAWDHRPVVVERQD